MDPSRLGATSRTVGLIVTLGAIGWWVVSFHHYFEDVGVVRCLTCLYSSSGICTLGSGVASLADGTPSYTPVLFWVGIGLLAAGVILRMAAVRTE